MPNVSPSGGLVVSLLKQIKERTKNTIQAEEERREKVRKNRGSTSVRQEEVDVLW